jgi:hypothetical protein
MRAYEQLSRPLTWVDLYAFSVVDALLDQVNMSASLDMPHHTAKWCCWLLVP